MECQFERNLKFKSDINLISADELRTQPIGKDKLGNAYWSTLDDDLNLRIYQEHLDEDIWKIVANNRDELSTLIDCLKGNDIKMPTVVGIADEDSSSNSMPPKIDALQSSKTDDKSIEESSSSTAEPQLKKAQQDEAKEADVKIKEKTKNGATVEIKQQKPKAQTSSKITEAEEDDDDEESEEEDEAEEEEDEDDSDDDEDDSDDESNVSEIDENSQAQSESSSGTINKKVKVVRKIINIKPLLISNYKFLIFRTTNY